jgi:hypothetical protein
MPVVLPPDAGPPEPHVLPPGPGPQVPGVVGGVVGTQLVLGGQAGGSGNPGMVWAPAGAASGANISAARSIDVVNGRNNMDVVGFN